jgi:membrane protease subunit HflC
VLAPRINGRLAAVIGTLPLDALASVADERAVDARTEALRSRLLGDGDPAADPLRERVRAEYGIEIVDLRLRRFGYPEAVRARIAERIRSERERKAADYESEGRRRAADIASAAEKEARTIEAEARARKQLVEGQADADADRIRNEAHAKDPKFYEFLQKLKAYQTLLSDTRDVLLLSSKHPLFDLLLAPPTMEKK